MSLDTELHKKCEKYRVIANKLREIKAEEMKLRLDICAELLKKAPVGLSKVIDEGLLIKATRKVTYKLDEEELEGIYDDLSDAEMACIKFKPNLILKNYKMLDDAPLLNDLITVQEATPTLDISIIGD